MSFSPPVTMPERFSRVYRSECKLAAEWAVGCQTTYAAAFWARKDDGANAERALWHAVLMRALADVAGSTYINGSPSQNELSANQREAREWLLSDDTHPSSCRWVLDMLMLPEGVGEAIREIAELGLSIKYLHPNSLKAR